MFFCVLLEGLGTWGPGMLSTDNQSFDFQIILLQYYDSGFDNETSPHLIWLVGMSEAARIFKWLHLLLVLLLLGAASTELLSR